MLTPPAPFDMSSARASSAWPKWKTAFEYYIVAAGITDDAIKRATLLHCVGPDVQQLFATLPDRGTTYESSMKALSSHFEPKRNIAFERHTFRQCKQQQNESVDEFHVRLQALASTCSFGDDKDDHIRDQFIDKCTSQSLRRRLLRETDLKLSDLMSIARAAEAADKQAAEMESSYTPDTARVHQLTSQWHDHRPGRGRPPFRGRGFPSRGRGNTNRGRVYSQRPSREYYSQHTSSSEDACSNCGIAGHRARDPQCPARGQECRECRKIGHYGRMCQSKRTVHAVTEEFRNFQPYTSDRPDDNGPGYDDHRRGRDDGIYSRPMDPQYTYPSHAPDDQSERFDDHHLFAIGSSKSTTRLRIADVDIDMHIDTGASVNVIDSCTYDRMKEQTSSSFRLAPTRSRLFPYGAAAPLPVLGEFIATISCSNTQWTTARFVVVRGNSGCLLSRDTATILRLVHITGDDKITHHADTVRIDDRPPPRDSSDLKLAYPEVFAGFGKLPDYKVHVHIDPNVTPVAQPARRIPFHLRAKVEEKLKELMDMDIIEKVSGPTTWASPLVVVPKPNGDIRVCVDMRRANQAVIRERHPIPTLDETLESLNGAALFSKLDLKWGYHQIELDEDSRDITTFVTHQGVMRYKRLIFGLSSASETYQYAIQTALQGLEGVRNISDDIVVFGKDVEEHDTRLHAVLERLREKHLTLNSEKCIFRAPRIMFFGFVISKDGIAADNARVAAIKGARRPTNQMEVRSFLGLVNYCARLIPNLATTAEPLRKLTRGHQPWTWGPEQQRAFDELRHALTSDDVMAHFVTGAPTELRVDASPVGLGAVLTQTVHGITRPVAYASRTLSDVERRYSQTEREALAVVWGCERFHLYLCGAEFVLHTDHKPLQFIYGPHGKPHARIERWVLRLQQYNFQIKHMAGKSNPADVLSRLPIDQPNRDRSTAEDYIDAILANAIPRALTQEQIASASQADHEIQRVIKALNTGEWPDDQELHAYRRISDELSTTKGILLRGNRIVIPRALRRQTLDIAHESHQGIVRLKQLLRTKVWWPKMDTEAEALVRMCGACQVEMPPPPSVPLQPSTMPRAPWSRLHVDLCGPLPTGETLLVVIDAATRWPEVEILRSTTANVIISRLDRIFAQHGYPDEIVTDNGPQFISQEFADYLNAIAVNHRRVTPYHPQANAEVERFNATIMKAIRTARNSDRDWHRAIHAFLLIYRSTPHPATKATPAKLLYNREIRTKLPSTRPIPRKSFVAATQQDKAYKAKMKAYHDKKRHSRPRTVVAGDYVIITQRKRDKFSSPFDPKPWIVLSQKRGSVKLRRGNETTMRYMSQIRRIPPPLRERDNDHGLEYDTRREYDNQRDQHNAERNQQADQQIRRSQRLSRPPNRLAYYKSGVAM